MQPQYVAFILAFAASAVMAAPVADAPPKYVELYSEPATQSNGTLVWLGEADDSSDIDRRATCTPSGDAPKCDSKHGARNDVCQNLLTELYANSANKVQRSPRQICYKGQAEKDAYCCVSWHKEVKFDITKGHLAPFVDKILGQCTQNGVSGLINNVHLGGQTCNKVCLSDRGTGC